MISMHLLAHKILRNILLLLVCSLLKKIKSKCSLLAAWLKSKYISVSKPSYNSSVFLSSVRQSVRPLIGYAKATNPQHS
jgi:hypothetical protein